MQLVAGIGATGKQQTVEILQRTQRLTRFTPALHQVKYARPASQPAAINALPLRHSTVSVRWV